MLSLLHLHCLQYHLVPVLALAILPHAVHSHQILLLAELVMETVIVVMTAFYLPIMTAVQMLPALEVSIELNIDS